MEAQNACPSLQSTPGIRLPSISAFLQREGCSLLLIVLLTIHMTFLLWPGLVPSWFFTVPAAGSLESADAIVFLGGDDPHLDGQHRARKSLGLLEEGKGRFILVTGENGFGVQRLKAMLPADKRVVEPAATSTWENAALSYPLLRARGVRSAILVTDWWHARRALACFHRLCPGIKLSVVAARPPGLDWSLTNLRREYMARLWYALRYGVW
jgi:uncharacterized SAM-binding protein YcdF (DUF218 family)